MKILLKCFIFLSLFSSYNLRAQDLANLKSAKPFQFSGSLGTKLNFYGADGITARQDPFSYGIDINATVSFYGVSMPFSFTWYDRNKSYSHPFNQYGLSPKYKWITAHVGYRSLTFSEFTLNGHTFLGAGVELTPGNWRIGALYGKFSESSLYDPYKAKEIPQLTRKGWAVKLGYGTEKQFIDFSMLRIGDNDKNYNILTDSGMPTPEQNVAMSLHGKISLRKNITFEAEGAMSIYTSNSKAGALNGDMDAWYSLSDGFITINQSSEHYSAFKSKLNWKITKAWTSGLEYRRIAPGYKSLGAYFFNNDVENISITQNLLLLKNKMNLRGSLGLQHDNLDDSKKFTSKRTIGSMGMSYQITQKFGFDANYNNFTTNQKAGTMAIIDSLKLFQVNKSYSFSPRYITANEKRSHMIMLVYNYSALDDKNKKTANQSETNTNIVNLTYALGLIPSKLTITTSLNTINLKNNLYTNTMTGITSGISKMLASDKLSISWNNSFMVNKVNSDKGTIFNTALSAGYRFLKNNNINFSFYYTSNKFAGGSATPSYNEYRGDFSYVYSF